MYIEIKEIDEVVYGGYSLKLPGTIRRYIDFEDCSVVLVGKENKRKLLFIGLFTDEKNITALKVRSEYAITGELLSFQKSLFREAEALRIRVEDIITILDPKSGSVVYEMPTKG